MFLKIPYADGKHILIQPGMASSKPENDTENLSKISNTVAEVNQSLEQVSITIVDMSSVMLGAFENLEDRSTKSSKKSISPVKATLEFGISFSAEGDIYVVKATGEASLKVTVEWEIKK